MTFDDILGKLSVAEAELKEKDERIESLEKEIEMLKSEGDAIIDQLKDIVKYHDKF